MAKGSSAKKSPKSISSLSEAREKPKMVPSVTALNTGQKNALRAIAEKENHVIFMDGIAGTGKTFIAASWGLEQLIKGHFDRMIITRPYVEAGENLGFLPGSYDDKIAPFMIPITDVFNEHMTQEMISKLVEDKKIRTLPLAYMRGVTFKKAFVLLDEAQNCTPKQMHLFLTRIGEGSKMVITGDVKQSDLGPYNGFKDALERLDGVKGLEIVKLDPNSVVRHGIIPEIDARYSDKR
jgi:phosphate starvation-inducible PhoH-like protein